jgi:ribonuclease P protein component
VRSKKGGILVLQGTGAQGQPQVGFVAGRKVGNAVQRNRAKRRMREAVLSVPLDPNTAYIVVASADVLDAEFTTLISWLEEAIEANRMKPPRNRS